MVVDSVDTWSIVDGFVAKLPACLYPQKWPILQYLNEDTKYIGHNIINILAWTNVISFQIIYKIILPVKNYFQEPWLFEGTKYYEYEFLCVFSIFLRDRAPSKSSPIFIIAPNEKVWGDTLMSQ
jgi:hypothetical protein